MDVEEQEVIKRSTEYLNRVFSEVDREIIEAIPVKLAFYAVHQIIMTEFPGLVTSAQMVEFHGSDGNKTFFAGGVARAIECIIAKAWDAKHSAGFISEPLPEKFRKCLELPAMFAGERPQ